MSIFLRQCRRQFLLIQRRPQSFIHAFLFFLIFLFSLPMMLHVTPHVLNDAMSGLVWIGCLFMALLTAEGLFQTAYEEGLFQQAFVAGVSLRQIVFAILGMQCLCLVLPILVLIPLATVSLGVSFKAACLIDLGVFLGMPTLLSLTALAAAFQVGFIQKVTLMAFIVLPLVMPILVFGSGLNEVFSISTEAGLGGCALLLAFSLLSLSGLPFAIAAILRLRFEG